MSLIDLEQIKIKEVADKNSSVEIKNDFFLNQNLSDSYFRQHESLPMIFDYDFENPVELAQLLDGFVDKEFIAICQVAAFKNKPQKNQKTGHEIAEFIYEF